MPAVLSQQTIVAVPALEQHGLAIMKRMYERMFWNTEFRDLFNPSHHGETGAQPRALAAAILAYAQNIGCAAVVAPALEPTAQFVHGTHSGATDAMRPHAAQLGAGSSGRLAAGFCQGPPWPEDLRQHGSRHAA